MKKHTLLILILSLFYLAKVTAQWLPSTNLNMALYGIVGGSLVDVDFLSEKSGMFSYGKFLSNTSGYQVLLISTTDSGKTWNTISNSTSPGNFSRAIHTIRNKYTYFHIRDMGLLGRVDKTSDDGTTWSNKSFGPTGNYQSSSVIDSSHYFLLYTMGNPSGTQYIHKYFNGIISSKIDSFYLEYAQQMFFADTTTGYISTSSLYYTNTHSIYKSFSSGTNWVKVFTDTLMNIRKMFFTNANIGYVVGDSGKIIKTNDGGSNWQHLNTSTSLNLKSIYFLNDSIGYAVGDSGLIIKTINGGTSWHRQISGATTSFSKIFFMNDSVGFALTGLTLYKTNQSPLMNVNKISKNNNYVVYPNPTNGFFTIKSENEKIKRLEIYNTMGEKIHQSSGSNTQLLIGLSSQPNGIYFLKIIDENGVSVMKKIIIK